MYDRIGSFDALACAAGEARFGFFETALPALGRSRTRRARGQAAVDSTDKRATEQSARREPEF
jgi:hypothetical protein